MKRLARIFGSITFRLALAYTLIFGLSVGGLFYFVYFSSTGFIVQQKEAAIEADVTGFQETYERSGITGLIIAVNRRSSGNTSRDGIYLLVDSVGSVLAGNLRNWPRNVVPDDIWINFTINDMRRAEPPGDVAPRGDRFDEDDRRTSPDHRAHHRRQPDRAAAEDRDARSRGASERVHHPARAGLEPAAKRPEQFERDL